MSDQKGEVGDSKFGQQVSLGLLGEAATAIVGLIGSVILARVLGPSSYGLFYLALSVANLLENPVTGWGQACKKRITETDFEDREAMGSLILAVTAMMLIGGPLAYFFIYLLSENEFLPLAVPILFVALSAYWSMKTILSGRTNFSLSVWSKVIQTILKICIQVTLVAVGIGIWGMVIGTALASTLVLPLIYHWIGVRPILPSKDSLRSIASFARWSIPTGFVGTSLSRMDIILLGWLATASAAGDYRISLALSMPATFVAGVIGTGLVGRISNLESRNEFWQDDYHHAISFSSILAVPMFFGGLVIGEELIVAVYGNQYIGAEVFLIGILLYRLLATQTTPRTSVINALNKPNLNFYISSISLIINVGFGIGLWSQYGSIGIIFATVITQIFSLLIRVYLVSNLTGNYTFVTRLLIKQISAGIVMLALVSGIKQLLELSLLSEVAILVVSGGAVYFGTLSALSSKFRSTIQNILIDLIRLC